MTEYVTQMEVFKTKVDAYNAELEVFKAVVERQRAQHKEGKMSGDRSLFTVFQVDNGFYARMADGTMVVGGTLSEVCAAASGKAAEQKITGKRRRALPPIDEDEDEDEDTSEEDVIEGWLEKAKKVR